MESEINKLKKRAIEEIKISKTFVELKKLEIKYLGRKGELTKVLRGLKNLAAEQKPRIGQLANEVKTELGNLLSGLMSEVDQAQPPAKNFLDITLPGKKAR